MDWNQESVFVAPEVPFMRSAANNREAGRIDRVLANAHSTRNGAGGPSERVALEVQAVYFSGKGMVPDFQALADDDGEKPPAPSAHRRPDRRSSSAKRLMPQRQVKVPTLRQWGKKPAVAVDELFFDARSGPSDVRRRDPFEGDIMWRVTRIGEKGNLERAYWEVLTPETSSERLRTAHPMPLSAFETACKENVFVFHQR